MPYTDPHAETETESDLVKHLRKEIAERDKTLKAKDEELGTLRTETRSSAISAFLTAKGANPGIAKFIGSDVETTDEALGKWYDENASLFGAPAAGTSPTPSGEGGEQEPTGVSPETEAALRAAQATQAAGQQGPAQIGQNKILTQVAEVKGKGPEAVWDYLREQGLASD